MKLPFCEKCKLNDKCVKNFELFENSTGNKRIPPESFCKEQHKKYNVDINNFYSNVVISNADNVKQLKFLFPEIKNDIEIIEKEQKEIRKLNNIEDKEEISSFVTLMLTEKCNLACEYCYERFSGNLAAQSMSKETIIKTVDFFFDEYIIKNKKTNTIWDIIGGEVFAEFELLKFVIEYIIQKYISNNICPRKYLGISLCSNGTLFSDEVKEWCLSIKDRVGNLGIGLSLDGIKECHDLCRNKSFNKVMSTFEWWRETFPNDSIKGTISPKTLKYLFENVKFYVDELKLPDFYINPTFEGPWTDEDAELYFEELIKCADFFINEYPEYDVLDNSNLFMNLKYNFLNSKRPGNWCGSGVHMRAISPTGDIYPCLRAITSNYHPLGNVHNEIKIDRNRVIPFYFYTSHNEEKECDTCAISSWCPTCVMQWYEDSKDIFERSKKLCTMTKTRFFASKYLVEHSELYKDYV